MMSLAPSDDPKCNHHSVTGVPLLIQLNIPKILNYNKNINEDVEFLEDNMSDADIDSTYKQTMVANLMEVAKNADLRKAIQQIETE